MTGQLSEELLADLGRLVVAASFAELALATVAGECLGTGASEAMGHPGAARRSARSALDVMTPQQREKFADAIGEIEKGLRRRHTCFHGIWLLQPVPRGLPKVRLADIKGSTTKDVADGEVAMIAADLRSAANNLFYLLGELVEGRLGSRDYLGTGEDAVVTAAAG